MFGIVPKVLWERQKKADDRNRVTMDMNCLLIRDADNVVVVETGAGPKLTDRQKEIFGIQDPPRLLDELKTLGVRPADVTLVINTHLHFDHSGGNTYRDTTVFFSSDFMPDRHHLPLPWIPAFDLFPLDTLAAKKLILRRAIDERWIVGFTHDLPRFGRISEAEGKFRFDEVDGWSIFLGPTR